MTGGGSGAMAATTGPSSSPRPKGKAKSKSKADADAGAEEMLSWRGFVKKPRAGLSLEGKNRHATPRQSAEDRREPSDKLKTAGLPQAGTSWGGSEAGGRDFAEQPRRPWRAEMRSTCTR